MIELDKFKTEMEKRFDLILENIKQNQSFIMDLYKRTERLEDKMKDKVD